MGCEEYGRSQNQHGGSIGDERDPSDATGGTAGK